MQPSPDYDSKRALPYTPEMWLSEIDYIEKTLVELAQSKEALNILEWGSGNSTIFFAKFLRQKGISFKWVAIEHFIPWYEKILAMLEENNLSDDVSCFLKSPTLETDKNVQETLDLDEYIKFPATLDTKFDFVIVDGRKRKECLEKASTILSQNGIAVLHDAEREWYHDGFTKYLNGGEFVTANPTPAAHGGVQKLWAGKVIYA
jgi:predicted O-methyltransferase YrrM